ncbi:MAG: gliding motility-associated C-terminal domain-containing protein, partial [Bacteroidetes bacterium]
PYVLTFTPATGQCAAPATVTVTVNPPTVPVLMPGTVCQTDPPFDLTALQDPAFPTGTWTGPGVSGNFFNPAGQSGSVSLIFTASGACVLPASTTITVNDPAMPALGTDAICDDNGLYDLTTLLDPNYPGGTWSGPGVTGNFFDPAGQSGNVTLTFTPSDNCVLITTTTITVNIAATPVLGTDDICENNGLYDLTQLEDSAYPGGTWSGPGVAANMFDPAGQSGAITLTYDAGQNCVQSAMTTITVQAVETPALDSDAICEDNGLYDLTTLQDPAYPTGTWSGPGVTGNFFDPAGQSGNVTLTFTSDQNCVEPATTTLTIQTIATPSLGTDQICENNGLYDLTQLLDPNYPNGTWSGPGVTGNFFDPAGQSGSVVIDFLSNENCVADASTTIEILTPTMPVLAQDTICENNGLYDLTALSDPLFPTGTWSGPGVTGNFFDPTGQSGTVTLTFASDQNCVEPATTDILVLASPTPALDSAQVCQSAGIFDLTALLDPAFPTGIWSGTGVTGNQFDPTGLSGTFVLTFTSDQNCVEPATTSIKVDTILTPQLNAADLCADAGIFDLTTLEDPAFPGGTWSGAGVSGTQFDPTGLSGTITLTYTPPGDCADAATTSIALHSPPGFTDFSENCMPGDPTFTISFTLTGGDSSTYTVNGTPVSGNMFVSPPIPNGTAYQFDIDDQFQCGPVVLSGSYNCDCTTNAGTMNFANTPIQVCDGNGFSVVHNENETLDPDDLLLFILHDLPGSTLGNIFATSDTTAFDFPSGIVFGQTYYVSAVAGMDDGTGQIDFTDGCLSVTPGVPVSFYQLDATLSGGGDICAGDCQTLNVSFTGAPPFELVYAVESGQGLFQDTLQAGSNMATITICPTDFGITDDTLFVYPLSLNDINCDNFTQSNIRQTIVVHPLPVSNLEPVLCPDDTLVVNGNPYHAGNPSGTEVFPNAGAFGCDSTVNIQLDFYGVAETTIRDSLCAGEVVVIHGTAYDQSNPSGTEILAGASANGCDSTIFVDLTFFPTPETTLDTTLCETGAIVINGTVYDISNPSGTEVFSGGSWHGCDSTVLVQLSFYPPVTFNFQQTICEEDTVYVNGQAYHKNHPSGTEILTGAAQNGCDSTVIVQLDFHPVPTFNFEAEVCPDAFFDINGTIYDINNPSGFETFENASYLGCDSIVQVSLTFFQPAISNLTSTLCTGSSIIVNGTVYDENNSTGVEILPNSSANGCDSTININLTFTSAVVFDLNATICEEDSIEVNGTVYNQSHPTGTETFENGSASGCDSVVNITLSFYASAEFFLNDSICEGSEILVNGTVYSADNQTGTEVLDGAAFNGCDSIIYVDLTVLPVPVFELTDTICPGDFVISGGSVYDINQPTGTETFPNGAANGCDSIVHIDLSFYPPAENIIAPTLCPGESILINGTVYDETNPTGFEILPGQSQHGCDSIISVNLKFHPPAEGVFTAELCEDESITINGTIYDQGNPAGTEIFPGGSFQGCDSVLQISLDFLPPATGFFTDTLIVGQTLVINGTVYDQNHPKGTEIFPNAAFNGCDSIVQIDLKFFEEISAVWTFDGPLCFGDQNGFIQIDTITGGVPGGYWVEFSGQPPVFYNQFPILFSDLSFGDYVVEIWDAAGQTTTLSASLPNPPQITVDLGPDQTVPLGGSITLLPQTNITPDSIQWTPADGLSCDNCFPVVAAPLLSTTYQLTLIDANGCSQSDEIDIFVQNVRTVYIPNVFSPNDDGVNDRFTVFAGNNVEEIVSLRIFGRWGEPFFIGQNFAPNDPAAGWDGTFNGEPLDPGVFVYFAVIRYKDGQTELFKGDVTLIK